MQKLVDWQGTGHICNQHSYQQGFRQKGWVRSEVLNLKSSCQNRKIQMNEQTQTQTDKQTNRQTVERPWLSACAHACVITRQYVCHSSGSMPVCFSLFWFGCVSCWPVYWGIRQKDCLSLTLSPLLSGWLGSAGPGITSIFTSNQLTGRKQGNKKLWEERTSKTREEGMNGMT